MSLFIKITDRNWIIEKLALELSSRLSYVDYGLSVSGSPDAVYYMTYSAWDPKEVSDKKIAFFTHIEEDVGAQKRFYDVASRVDHRVCMADRYAELLNKQGYGNCTTIVPGVDLEKFDVKLTIGVVGRTYHTGRKGEALVETVIDTPNIAWKFTGSGWPQAANHVGDDDMPDFYRSLDFLLIPSKYEGGPMPLIEALACGVPVIAPDVGFVEKFPHIPYILNDAADLRRVLEEQVSIKQALRKSVESTTWDQWAEQHDRLFEELKVSDSASQITELSHKVDLVLHGSERTTLGGPSLRVPRTALELSKLGHHAVCRFGMETPVTSEPDLVHVFNAWQPASAVHSLEIEKDRASRCVFSPIYLGLAEMAGFQHQLPAAARTAPTLAVFKQRIELLRENGLLGTLALKQNREPEAGYFARIQYMLSLADHVICLSQKEQDQLLAFGLDLSRTSIARNPVDVSRFSGEIDNKLFSGHIQADEYILSVGRIESRKNQLLLAIAARELDVTLVLIGHVGDSQYMEQVLAWGGDKLIHLPRMEPEDPLFLSAFSGAACFALPSFSEGAPLSALEAAAAGCSLVLSDRSGEVEYFGEHARYCDPSSVDSIRESLREALLSNKSDDAASRKRQLVEFVTQQYSWEIYAEQTAVAYQQALVMPPKGKVTDPSVVNGDELAVPNQMRVRNQENTAGEVKRISHNEFSRQITDSLVELNAAMPVWVDVTTTLHNSGSRITGINRVEAALSQEMVDQNPSCQHVCWVGARMGIRRVEQLLDETTINQYRTDIKAIPDNFGQDAQPEPGSHFLVSGSAWMQNAQYTKAIERFVADYQLVLTVVVYDLVPCLFPQWYVDGYSKVFESNLRRLCDSASRLLCISQSTASDLRNFLPTTNDDRIRVISLGSTVSSLKVNKSEAAGEGQGLVAQQVVKPKRPFALAVGAVHPRKNYELLYNVWVELLQNSETDVPDLVIVGGFGWHSEWLKHAVQTTPALKDRWHVVSGIDDAQLAELYSRCLFTVYPSLYEGWGLPVAESMEFGKVCLCSNRSSIPEVADNHLLVSMDPFDTRDWMAKIVAFTRNAESRRTLESRIAKEYKPGTWQNCVTKILGDLPEGSAKVTDNRVYQGEVIRCGAGAVCPDILGQGWSVCESDGVFTIGNEATILWDYTAGKSASRAEDGVWIQYKAYLPRSRLIQTVEVHQGGSKVDEWIVSDGAVYVRKLPLSASQGDLTFRLANTFKPHLVDNLGDMRNLGIKLQAIGFGLNDAAVEEKFKIRRQVALDVFRHPASISNPIASRDIEKAWGYTGFAKQGVSLNWTSFDRNVSCTVVSRTVATQESPVFITYQVNGVPITTRKITSSNILRHRFEIPIDVQRLNQPIIVRASLSNIASPASIGVGLSETAFGIGLYSIELSCKGSNTRHSESLPWILDNSRENQVASSSTKTIKEHQLGRGWYELEEGRAWSWSSVSNVHLPEIDHSIEHVLQCDIAWPDGLCPIRNILLNGSKAKWQLLDVSDNSATLCVILKGPATLLSIVLPNDENVVSAIPQVENKTSSIQLCSLTVVPKPEKGSHQLGCGWYSQEEAGAWTGSMSAELLWSVPDCTEATLNRVPVIKLSTIGNEAQEVNIVVDNSLRITVPVNPNELTEVPFTLPVRSSLTDDLRFVRIDCERLNVPEDLGMSEDTRGLGIFLHSIDYVEQEQGLLQS